MFASGVNSAYSPTPWGFLNICLSYLELRSKPRFSIPMYQSIFRISSRSTLTFRDFKIQILCARVLERKSEILGKSSDNPGKRLQNRRIYGCSSNPKPVGSNQFQFSLVKMFWNRWSFHSHKFININELGKFSLCQKHQLSSKCFCMGYRSEEIQNTSETR